MRLIGAVAGLLLAGLFGLLAYGQVVGFTTAGTLSGTNQQTIFDQLPTILILLAVVSAAGVAVVAVRMLRGSS